MQRKKEKGREREGSRLECVTSGRVQKEEKEGRKEKRERPHGGVVEAEESPSEQGLEHPLHHGPPRAGQRVARASIESMERDRERYTHPTQSLTHPTSHSITHSLSYSVTRSLSHSIPHSLRQRRHEENQQPTRQLGGRRMPECRR